MTVIDNDKGVVNIADEVFANIVGHAATSCYGVVNMANRNTADGIVSFIKKDNLVKGVKVEDGGDNSLNIELHIIVLYGVNIPAITKSITHKVGYTVEELTGLRVKQLKIYVDYLKVE